MLDRGVMSLIRRTQDGCGSHREENPEWRHFQGEGVYLEARCSRNVSPSRSIFRVGGCVKSALSPEQHQTTIQDCLLSWPEKILGKQ